MWHATVCTTDIGVASYGALEHVPLSTSNCLIFLVASERTNSDIGLSKLLHVSLWLSTQKEYTGL